MLRQQPQASRGQCSGLNAWWRAVVGTADQQLSSPSYEMDDVERIDKKQEESTTGRGLRQVYLSYKCSRTEREGETAE